MSVLDENARVNDYFLIVGPEDPLVPLETDAQDEDQQCDGHPLNLRYRYVVRSQPHELIGLSPPHPLAPCCGVVLINIL